ncbi:hypothetical protein PHLCEN_2v338 [Hermanssonia centrifuga]|uniref:BTB domain-containing protein n=1 Tax=Hermanssonia centrifuga TaxID=98765 RepID=A0A2R6S6F0_9APHY|nr:hypothetical protein PHLCEN_2v338 [Hermanssonia centrifuga]
MSSPDTEFSSNAHASQNRFPLTEFEVPSRHPDLSFPDGNVVLLTGHQYFVVHQGLLFRHSSVLKEMSDELSSIDVQYLEGRPVLQLPHTPDDMYYFLRVLYGLASYNDTLHFPVTSALLRLSTLYKVESIRADVLQRLLLSWPLNLSQWEAREKSVTNVDGVYAPRPVLPHPIVIIELAREVDAPELLPAAFYDLSRYLPSQLAAGYTDPHTAVTHYLSAADLFKVFRGKEQAARCFSTFIVKELEGRSVSEFCLNRHEIHPSRKRRCQIAFEAVTYSLIQDINGLVLNRNSDPLFAVADSLHMQTRGDVPGVENRAAIRACEACRLEYGELVENMRQDMWRRIPEWFELDVSKRG